MTTRIGASSFLVVVSILLVACAGPGGQTAGTSPAAPAGPAGPPASLEKVTIALPSVSGVFVPYMLGLQEGFFREEGLDVELPAMRSNLVTAALAAGEADYTGMFGPSVRD
jgi:ABC-type nitrate/sulfonate/bicarbonate transport system substrate-binding protein